jgi:hypothetical protein
MKVDAHNLFSDAQAVTAAAASTNLIDLGVSLRNMGVGTPIYIVSQVDVAFTDSSSDSTLAVTLEQDTAAAFSSTTSIQTVGTFAALAAIGARLVAAISIDVITEQFVRLYYTPANGNLSTGSVTSFLTDHVQAYTSYADGVTIS